MGMSGWAIRRFLMRKPRAELIRLTVRGVPQDMKVTRGMSLSKIGDSIAAVEPDVIELFDGDGTLLRAVRPEGEADANVEQPKPPKGLEADPETLRFTHVASLLARAYQHATDVAFAKVVDLADRLEARGDAQDQRLERLETMYRQSVYGQLRMLQEHAMEQLEQGEELPEDGEDMLKQMFNAFMQGRAQRAARQGKPNGARKPNGSGNGAPAPEPKGEA